jgi:hypothetical protein
MAGSSRLSDEGDLLRARVVLDGRGTLTGIGEAQLTKLVGLDGRPLETKEDGDAEGLAVLPNGDLLVSFERRHRIWRYPAAGDLPAEAPFPRVTLLENAGIEALFADPSRGPGAYIAGAEARRARNFLPAHSKSFFVASSTRSARRTWSATTTRSTASADRQA